MAWKLHLLEMDVIPSFSLSSRTIRLWKLKGEPKRRGERGHLILSFVKGEWRECALGMEGRKATMGSNLPLLTSEAARPHVVRSRHATHRGRLCLGFQRQITVPLKAVLAPHPSPQSVTVTVPRGTLHLFSLQERLSYVDGPKCRILARGLSYYFFALLT